jgi:hypothetical protein
MLPYRTTTMHPPPGSYYLDRGEDGIADTGFYSASMRPYRRASTLPIQAPRPMDGGEDTANSISEGLYLMEIRSRPHQTSGRTSRGEGDITGIPRKRYRLEVREKRRHTAVDPTPPPPDFRRIWVITGGPGAGKSRVREHLRKKLHYVSIECDDVSPPPSPAS